MYFDTIVSQGLLVVRGVCPVVVCVFCSFFISGVLLRNTVFRDGFKMSVVYRKKDIMYLFCFCIFVPSSSYLSIYCRCADNVKSCIFYI